MFENCVAGWSGHYLCDPFYCCSRLCPVLPVCDPSFCCYLHLVILVVPICTSRLSQTLFDWLIVTQFNFAPFSCGLFSLIFMMYLFISSGWQSLWLVVLVFGLCSEFCGCMLLLAVGCLLLCDCYDWSCQFSRNVLTFAVVCYSLL